MITTQRSLHATKMRWGPHLSGKIRRKNRKDLVNLEKRIIIVYTHDLRFDGIDRRGFGK
jgi:hypothetical protein